VNSQFPKAVADHKVKALIDSVRQGWNPLRITVAVRAERQHDVAGDLVQHFQIGEANSVLPLNMYLVAMIPAPFNCAVRRSPVDDDELVVPGSLDAGQDGLHTVDLI